MLCCAALDNMSLPMQTYRHAVIEPGARLNLVLGPNGEQRHLLAWPRAAPSVRALAAWHVQALGRAHLSVPSVWDSAAASRWALLPSLPSSPFPLT